MHYSVVFHATILMAKKDTIYKAADRGQRRTGAGAESDAYDWLVL